MAGRGWEPAPHFQPIALQPDDLFSDYRSRRIVLSEVGQDAPRPYSAQVHFVAQLQIGLHRVIALLLQL